MAAAVAPAQINPIAQQVGQILYAHTKAQFIGLIVFGSAVKGGVIAGCSDIDFKLFLKSGLDQEGCLPLDVSCAIHRRLAQVDPAPFRYIQCTPFALDSLPEGYLGPVPNTYQVVRGQMPVQEATATALRAAAATALAHLNADPSFAKKGLLDHGGGRLQQDIRLLCTKVWPVLFQLLCLVEDDAVKVWQMSKTEAMTHLPDTCGLATSMTEFYRAVCQYYPEQQPVQNGLAVIKTGVRFLATAKSWWQQHGGQPPSATLDSPAP